MKDYLLFIDTEASGLPRKWNLPYSRENNWPHALQVSWIIYSKDQKEVKREDHYINESDFEISAQAFEIHKITRELLSSRGESRRSVMQLLADDLKKYKPLVIGHFLELDYHVLAADFYRSDVANPFHDEALPAFCTMLGSTKYVRNPSARYVRLGELYNSLFNRDFENPHNALADAGATADCFFELLNRGDITEKNIEDQKLNLNIQQYETKRPGWVLLGLLLIIILIIVLGNA